MMGNEFQAADFTVKFLSQGAVFRPVTDKAFQAFRGVKLEAFDVYVADTNEKAKAFIARLHDAGLIGVER